MKSYVFAITGASGAIIGVRVLRELLKHSEVHLIISRQSFFIMKDESGIDWNDKSPKDIERKIRKYFGRKNLYFWHDSEMTAPVASGSFRTDGMFIVPCSMKTLAGIASGYSVSLVERAADVTLKEARPLLLSPREMPFSAVHLENMLKLSRLGVRIVPPVAAFYHKPKDLNELVDFFAGKILDAMGIEHEIFNRWRGI